MIKGIYNENEFYTNHYWATKYFDELKSKIQNAPNLKDKIEQLKSISTVYWDLADAKDISSSEKNDLFESFYQKLFEILGHTWLPVKRQTLDGRYYSPVSETKKDSKSHVLVALTNQKETGSFENVPYQLTKLDFDEQEEADDRELTEIVSEELESETGPKWYILGSLDGLFLIERTKWAYGRFIRIDFTEVFSQKDEDVYTSVIGLFSKDVLAPDSGISIHSELDDNSHRYAFAVTTELREGVREAIELLINEMIYAKREAKQEFLKKGKESNEYAKELSHDALFYVYRLIFLLFLESQGEDLELLPLKSEIYRHGYMLEKLFEVTFRKIHEGTQEYEGTFIQESLERIFDLIYNGFTPQKSADLIARDLSTTGFLVKGLKSDLFDPEKVKHLKGVTLRNGVLQKILQKLSMADMKEGKKTRKARVSYANLGINQLGAVYEGLLSYTGFFAQEDLYELTQVKKGKDEDEESDESEQDEIDDKKLKIQKIDPDKVYLAPKSLVEKYKKDKKYKLTEKHFVLDPETGDPVVYKKGSFMFRMAGRDRQKLASFYTPESLSRCTVKYSLQVLFEKKQSLTDLRKIKILEPAMGSGAFLNEAVNQLADRILEFEVKENFATYKTPRDRQKRLWDIKYELISNNVYGVDLNPTAIELARFSLWLNCIGASKEPPKFENKLKVGNSLVGARFKKNADGIFPWLMLDQGMLDYGKKLAEYDKVGADKIKLFRDSFLKSELKGTDDLLQSAQKIAEHHFSNLIQGIDTEASFGKLKMCCDLWCAYFFLSATDIGDFPKTHKDLISHILEILNSSSVNLPRNLQDCLEQITKNERFFHWEIEYPTEISSGGFDLILGNPPWVAVEWQDAIYVSDYNVIPLVLKLNAANTRIFVKALDEKNLKQGLNNQFIRVAGYSNFLETEFYHLLKGVQKNTYKAFDVLGFFLLNSNGSFGIIQEDGILEDKSANSLRDLLYRRYKFHFQFQNEKKLFSEVANSKRFSLNIFSGESSAKISFSHIGNLFLPKTIDDCFTSNSEKLEVPLIKDTNGSWDTLGHEKRIVTIDRGLLDVFTSFNRVQNDSIESSPLFINLHSEPLIKILNVLAKSELRLKNLFQEDDCKGSAMFDEVAAEENKIIEFSPGKAKSSETVVLSGPNIHVLNPFYQSTQTPYKNHRSYDEVDLESIKESYIPGSAYKLKAKRSELMNSFPTVSSQPYLKCYKLATRGMINPSRERSLFIAILPPDFTHINSIKSLAISDNKNILIAAGFGASLILDGLFRIQNKTNVFPDDLRNMPVGGNNIFYDSIARRVLCLVGLTDLYLDLWKHNLKLFDKEDIVLSGAKLVIDKQNPLLSSVKSKDARKLLLVEIDSLVALSFGFSKTELVQWYSNLCPIMHQYDRESNFNRTELLIEKYEQFEKRGW